MFRFSIVLLFLWNTQAIGWQALTEGHHVSMITLTRADSGKTVEIHPGDTVVMRLDENPTTGYQWALETSQEEVVTLLSTDYVPARGVGVGGGGQRLFTFKVAQIGSTTLRFKLWHTWEGDTSIRERFSITLQISE